MHWEIFDFCYNRLKFVKDIGSWTYLLGLISKEISNPGTFSHNSKAPVTTTQPSKNISPKFTQFTSPTYLGLHFQYLNKKPICAVAIVGGAKS